MGPEVSRGGAGEAALPLGEVQHTVSQSGGVSSLLWARRALQAVGSLPKSGSYRRKGSRRWGPFPDRRRGGQRSLPPHAEPWARLVGGIQ